MKELLVKYAKVPEYDEYLQIVEELNEPEQVSTVYDFIDCLYRDQYKELKRIFGLPINNSPNGPELWDRYFANERYELIEVRMFRKQSKLIRQIWNRRPFKKVKENGQAEDSQVHGLAKDSERVSN